MNQIANDELFLQEQSNLLQDNCVKKG